MASLQRVLPIWQGYGCHGEWSVFMSRESLGAVCWGLCSADKYIINATYHPLHGGLAHTPSQGWAGHEERQLMGSGGQSSRGRRGDRMGPWLQPNMKKILSFMMDNFSNLGPACLQYFRQRTAPTPALPKLLACGCTWHNFAWEEQGGLCSVSVQMHTTLAGTVQAEPPSTFRLPLVLPFQPRAPLQPRCGANRLILQPRAEAKPAAQTGKWDTGKKHFRKGSEGLGWWQDE